ncbi:hypothetical protein SAMN05444149_10725 [Pseudosulfitobacter pseudonitzschiae]|uniref:Uncharacterized protein n=1 Tax=Pseudosulfitobacter pseudonitzschiae TaxID=1402135 RepID=A0A073IYZ3_9RHOB|nr:hypothetical protein [Pseudosulfitobacter pseudonitzschiae]KEJ94850.1 hypothetical protein SUH3_24005 [Pseudosulfitobacter pseudonitzschiae]QKS07327.1 hypothetical protein HT745_01960 [Pseudosulfitobacter pseudonitzschiae]SHF95087.1 hypothetical protein SAMN05444149_10725 [Pseudosulfitobacter pseudonitzschiae]
MSTAIATLLSRLIIVLAVVLFGGHQAERHAAVSETQPSAAMEAAFTPVILTAQCHIARADLPESDTPPAAPTAQVAPAPLPTQAASVAWSPSTFHLTSCVSILHPVRGPPTV